MGIFSSVEDDRRLKENDIDRFLFAIKWCFSWKKFFGMFCDCLLFLSKLDCERIRWSQIESLEKKLILFLGFLFLKRINDEQRIQCSFSFVNSLKRESVCEREDPSISDWHRHEHHSLTRKKSSDSAARHRKRLWFVSQIPVNGCHWMKSSASSPSSRIGRRWWRSSPNNITRLFWFQLKLWSERNIDW